MRTYVLLSSSLIAATIAACSSGDAPRVDTNAGAISESSKGAPPAKLPASANPYTLFESLQVRPIALSPNGKLLFVTNTPDNRLEIFSVNKGALQAIGSVEVGLEPVAVAARNDNEVWVVNHLSDSLSVVDVSHADNARVVRTMLVGDEPRDIVFGGANRDKAFVTTAHRGQNSPDDPQLDQPNAGRADVWVFDANDTSGNRLTKLTFFADTPRALAVSADGSRVYAAAHFSGNQTTMASPQVVQAKYAGTALASYNGMPGPGIIPVQTPQGVQYFPQPQTGLIVKWNATSGDWVDFYGTHYGPADVSLTLPDKDVFAIDATQAVPVAIAGGEYKHVGTTLFNMAVNPVNGKIYVSNTDAHNDVRFEGDAHSNGSSVRGNIVDSRITVIDPSSGNVSSANLNPHLNHAAGTGDASLSRAFPQDLTVSHDGKKLLVVAQGSSKLAIYNTADIEAGNATPTAGNQVVLTGGGPTGVALDEGDGVAFVHTRFDNGVSIVSLASGKETSHVKLFNPEPPSVTAGRQYLYDAKGTSTLGDQACASCHIGADFDGLAWDLGNPGALPLSITTNAPVDPATGQPNESTIFTAVKEVFEPLFGKQQIDYVYAFNQPAKGPMTTQSLRGMDNHGAMHWRGDRNGAIQQSGIPFLDGNGAPVVSQQPNGGIFDEMNAFKSFNVAFPGLVGNATQLSDADMTAYATFALQISYPPNPIRALDNSLTQEQQFAQAFYFQQIPGIGGELPVDRVHNCNGCHTLDRNGNAGNTAHPGFFGTDGRLSFENESQIFKVPHLRNAYQKIGMSGSSPDATHAFESMIPYFNHGGDAVRGFGFNHDGAVSSPEQFFSAVVFIKATANVQFGSVLAPPNPGGIPVFNNDADPLNPATGVSIPGAQLRHALQSLMFAFDTNMFPIVGQQTTLSASNVTAAASRIALLEAQATAGACDLVVRGFVKGRDTGFVFVNGAFRPDTTGPSLSLAQLEALLGAATDALTFTAVPPGSGYRIGIDRDGDGYADGDERATGSDPADPANHP